MIEHFLRSFGMPERSALMEEATPLIWLAKLIGAVAGSLISIAYILPHGRREAVLRLCVGVVTGLIFGGAAGVKIADSLDLLDKVSSFEISIVGAAFASLCAWWGLGVLQRLAERLPLNTTAGLNGQSKKRRQDQ